jgi:hypothetical protein
MVLAFFASVMVTIPLAPIDAVRITILMDNLTDPLLFPTQPRTPCWSAPGFVDT